MATSLGVLGQPDDRRRLGEEKFLKRLDRTLD